MGQPEEDVPTGAAAGPSSSTKTEFPGSGQPLGAKPTSATPAPASSSAKPATPHFSEAHIESVSDTHAVLPDTDIQLTSFGVTREQAIQLLEAAGGNVDVAASMMFG